MPLVLRWSRTAYETDPSLAGERAAAEALGWEWDLDVDRKGPPVRLAEADVLVVTSKVRVDAAVMAGFTGRLVLTTTSGVDHLDIEAIRAGGAVVARCPQARCRAVAEHTLASLLRSRRRLAELEAASEAGHWARGDLPRLQPGLVRGARIGVVGLGVIGRTVADLLDALGARVVGIDPFVDDPGRPHHDLDDVLETLDAITLHCQSTPTSRGLLSAERLARLRPDAVVVNTARGDLLDVRAAVASVAGGRLGGLVCDVFPEEPWPELAAGASVPGVAFTPHASGHHADLGKDVAREVAAALAALAAGETIPGELSAVACGA